MNTEIIINHNKGYKWYALGDIYFRGYLIESDGTLYKKNEAIRYFHDVEDLDSLRSKLKHVDGVFSLIIKKKNTLLCAVDRARSLPIFFANSGNIISDSAEVIRSFLSIKPENVDEDSYLALYAKGYVAGNNTVYEEIKQLDCGELVVFSSDGTYKIQKYYLHTNDVKNLPYEETKQLIYNTAINTFNRLKKVIDGRPVVLSLSGGYDSRFVACMLKKVGIENVSCYTYGKKDSFEVKQSKKNAEALGYRWTCVEYTDEIVLKLADDEGLKFLGSFDTHDYTGYLQNYPAVRALHEQGWFEKDSVFITGLCGDMPTGYYIPANDPSLYYNRDYTTEWLYKIIYARQSLDYAFKEKWKQHVAKDLEENSIKVQDYQSFISAIDYIYTKNCHSRAFLHMNRVHEFYGYEWLLPFWDVELLSLWYSIPAQYRYKQSIYEDLLLTTICSEYGIGQKKTTIGYSPNPIKRKVTYFVGSILVYVFFHMGIPFRRRFDFNNWAPLELKFYKKLKTKKTVVWHKAAIVSIYTQYCLQNRYGIKNMINAKRRFNK